MNDTLPVPRRYERRIENDGTWTVFDTFTGKPADLGSHEAIGMEIVAAEKMVVILNRIHPADGAGTIH